jgi:hypothetical protein
VKIVLHPGTGPSLVPAPSPRESSPCLSISTIHSSVPKHSPLAAGPCPFLLAISQSLRSAPILQVLRRKARCAFLCAFWYINRPMHPPAATYAVISHSRSSLVIMIYLGLHLIAIADCTTGMPDQAHIIFRSQTSPHALTRGDSSHAQACTYRDRPARHHAAGLSSQIA